MKKILVSLQHRSYIIGIDASFKNIAQALTPQGKKFYHKILIVTHPHLHKLYGADLAKALQPISTSCAFAFVPVGESSKSLNRVQQLYTACLKNKLDRSCAIVALGGGVIGDLAGFVAATWLRGIDILQVPTTLLAMVDSSIGGKTGVDLSLAKNSVGAFHQPRLVWINTNTLKTLPQVEFTNGMAEVIKYGVIKDSKLFSLLEKKQPSGQLLEDVIYRCAKIKANVVAKDERETKGLREILNFGHTFGHAVESVTAYKAYKHGQAVALGMCAATQIALQSKMISAQQAGRIESLIQSYGLPTRLAKKLSRTAIAEALSNDKKVLNGTWRFVLPTKIGHVVVERIQTQTAMPGFDYISKS